MKKIFCMFSNKNKYNFIFILFIFIFITIIGSGCSNKLKLTGYVKRYELQGYGHGYSCWVFVTDGTVKDHFEILTPDKYLLKEGRRAHIIARIVKRQSVCKLPACIEILQYNPDLWGKEKTEDSESNEL